jgi:hypothetical protein
MSRKVREPAGEPIEIDDHRNRAILDALMRLHYPFDCELDHTCAKKSITGAAPRRAGQVGHSRLGTISADLK